jgi:hypothetical protein
MGDLLTIPTAPLRGPITRQDDLPQGKHGLTIRYGNPGHLRDLLEWARTNNVRASLDRCMGEVLHTASLYAARSERPVVLLIAPVWGDDTTPNLDWSISTAPAGSTGIQLLYAGGIILHPEERAWTIHT